MEREKHILIKEEIANAITHGIGALLAIAALVLLIVQASLHGTVWHIVSFSVFGFTLVALYFASTLYHSIPFDAAKRIFHKLDHIAIYWLIAGTYTPFCLTALRGWIGWTMFGVVWALAIGGTVVKSISVGRYVRLSTYFYVGMGWVVLLAIKPLYESVSTACFTWLILGGVAYTGGTYFFLKERWLYNHSIWHMFVLAGSICHFFAVLYLLD
jgi:hemolysin III